MEREEVDGEEGGFVEREVIKRVEVDGEGEG